MVEISAFGISFREGLRNLSVWSADDQVWGDWRYCAHIQLHARAHPTYAALAVGPALAADLPATWR
jgi:hypothetical protein